MNGATVNVAWDPQTQNNCLQCWDYSVEMSYLQKPEDLQLAAELGKTLLERNKELENLLKAHESTIEEQAQEIEYTRKQTAALREVNDSRMKIYEQLEVSIQNLERANHRLIIEHANDSKLIKSKRLTIENLEARIDDLQKKLDEVTNERDALVQQKIADGSTNTIQTQTQLWKAPVTHSGSIKQSAALSGQKPSPAVLINEEEVTELLRQLREAQNQRAREQKKVSELEQQLAALLQESNDLEEQLKDWRNKAQAIKNLQEEINTLEEVRQGQLCARCLRGMESRTHDDLFVMLNQEEYDEINISRTDTNDSPPDSESFSQDSSYKDTVAEDPNGPYTVLVEKYEALLQVHRQSAVKRKNSTPSTCMSLQDELKMSCELNSLKISDPAPKTQQQDQTSKIDTVCNKKSFSSTPTEFSEAETLSSGYMDETTNRGTQTEDRAGFFLCSIADGDDCKFSIFYNENSPFESRFERTPAEHRQIFKNILDVVKRNAEGKNEGEKLSLPNDSHNQNSTTLSYPQSSTLQEDIVLGETTDDNKSVVSSVLSLPLSEPVQRLQMPESSNGVDERKIEDSKEGPKNQEYEDYLLMNGTKKPVKKQRGRKQKSTIVDVVPTVNPNHISPKYSGKKKFRLFTTANQNGSMVNGSYSYTNKNRSPNSDKRQNNNSCSRNSNEQKENNASFGYKVYKPSTASQEVARLKRLEMSYAEVLQMTTKSKISRRN
ncbi:cerebellar degeneration-related protein 2-like isoform X2 [Ceratina calcarata]|uniref:Cerebellar degeneration-related protein 2-like isoform X2 n=1 Tax=Ceratina calcarata TaxID=156304 RepID=A0AAJ7IT43_9HYME|nr:cerebellar degeneration-related protein 2-like isoform X2 [Ceratina calcarata]